MRYRQIPNTTLNVSTIGLGTWVFGGDMWGGASEKDCREAVGVALDCGINLIDTAPIYGDGRAEEIVGCAIKGRRQSIILTTKCGLVRKGKQITIDLTPASIQKEIEASLKRLQVEYIDIYQCHWPDPATPLPKTLEALAALKKSGKIRYIGVSNFDLRLLQEAVQITSITSLQNHFSILERTAEKEILPFSQSQGISFLAYGPLGGGILSGKYPSPVTFKSSDARGFFYKFYQGDSFGKAKEIMEVLRKIPHPMHETAINWVRQREGVTSVLVGCRNAAQAKANAMSAQWDLSVDELSTIAPISV